MCDPAAQSERDAESAVRNGRACDTLGNLRQRSHTLLVRLLVSRGASPTEAEDVLADLWADCVAGTDDRPSLLEKFRGRCSIEKWLATVATRRWFDFKRRQERHAAALPPEEIEAVAESGRSQSSEPQPQEDILLSLLRESLEAAFANCSPRSVVLLRLVYLHGLAQKEVGRLVGWSESKVSRVLAAAMQEIETQTLQKIRKRDPWVRLNWQDFLDLCDICGPCFI